MRIAIANAAICVSKGGSERSALRLADELRKRGHDVRLLTIKTKAAPVYDIPAGLPTHFLPFSFFMDDSAVTQIGADILASHNTDILVSLESDANHLRWGRMCAQAQVPQVCSERITPWLIENELWNRTARRKFLHACAGIHELLPCYLPYVPEEELQKTFVIPNVAPDNLLDNFPERGEMENPVLLYLGRFSNEKRPALLLEAFSLLAKEFPKWRLRFAGWGDKEEDLIERRERHKLNDRVDIGLASKDVSQEYLYAALYCLPTLHEGLPNTVLEAMGHGLPIVGIKDCIAMESIIKPGETGILAEEARPEALAVALRPLLADWRMREKMGKAAYDECKKNYCPGPIFDQWEKELAKVVERSAAKNR